MSSGSRWSTHSAPETSCDCLPPGFGAPVPPGWRATPTAYRDWLAGKLEALAQPVDLVGHDWGGAHVVGVAMTRPELLRSWCTDSIGWFEPDYAWHTLARAWQTPGVGETSVAAMTTGGGAGPGWLPDFHRCAGQRRGALGPRE